MKGNFKVLYLTLAGLFVISQSIFAQIGPSKDSKNPETVPLVSGVHTLSIHVRDTLLQDSVYQFLVHKLMLPIYYTPVQLGQKKYAGIYVGNMVLEPCGPYQNTHYATDNFRAIFYGLNFEVYNSLASSEQALNMRGIKHQVNKGSIYIRDSILCNENIFTALYEVNDIEKRDSLRNTLKTIEKSEPGIEYIKEIFIGYKEEVNFLKWKEYLYPLEIMENDICQINDSLQLHFTRGSINEVKGITMKVESLEKTKQYMLENHLVITESDKEIKLDHTQSFGLTIFFSEEK